MQDLDEEEWEPMASVVGVPLPDEDASEELASAPESTPKKALAVDVSSDDASETDLLEADMLALAPPPVPQHDLLDDDLLEIRPKPPAPRPPPPKLALRAPPPPMALPPRIGKGAPMPMVPKTAPTPAVAKAAPTRPVPRTAPMPVAKAAPTPPVPRLAGTTKAALALVPAARSSFVDLDELLDEVARDDSSTRPVPFTPSPRTIPPGAAPTRRWPYGLLALAAGVLVAYGLSTKDAPANADRDSSHVTAAVAPATLQPAETPTPEPAETPTPEPAENAQADGVEVVALDDAVPVPDPVAEAAPEATAEPVVEPTPVAEAEITHAASPRAAHASLTPRPRTDTASERVAEAAPAQTTSAQPAATPHAAVIASPVHRPAPAVQANREDLPEVPSRDQVQAAFTQVLPTLRACTSLHGAVPIRVTISGSGRVTTAVVQGNFAGTAEGSCLARAVRTAHLPAFREPRLSVNYPFVL